MHNSSITSLQNPLIKEVVKLQQKAQERKKLKQFVIEGVREVSLALQAGITPLHLFICEDFYVPESTYPVTTESIHQHIRYVNPEVYNKMAYRHNAEGIIMVAGKYNTGLNQIKLTHSPVIIVLEGVEKPGNLGAILRTADAAGVDAIIICDPQTDIFNPNVIRSGLGCLFTQQVALCSNSEFFDWARENRLKVLLASLQATKNYYDADMTKPLAMAFGTEAHGLSEEWYEKADEALKIPMSGRIDSLNVSASVAVMAFEARRQRLQKAL